MKGKDESEQEFNNFSVWLEKDKRRALLSCSFWEDKTKGGSANQLPNCLSSTMLVIDETTIELNLKFVYDALFSFKAAYFLLTCLS
ncbi:ABC transporter B family member 11-like protein [Corchorus olitorius]|uniref:ABC transporter B family member 11-like protein n=1 Tax=Corchorus olitorius TaxID=93759 RepID=A0A1R3KL06_9ROSI|nr:ABC transporter B family member 11-like protein [Corchorus olitorius]